MLSQLEREPGEFIVDPWVVERATLVGEQRGRVTAAAHVLRYRDGTEVGEAYRNAGEIRWLLCWPEAPYWPDSTFAGDAVATGAVSLLSQWRVHPFYPDGTLPAPGVCGIPEQWPHVHAILQRAGFVPGTSIESVWLADVGEMKQRRAPLVGLAVARTLGMNGTRLSATLNADVVGYVEVDTRLGDVNRAVRHEGWADIGNFHIEDSEGAASVAGSSARQRIGFGSAISTGYSPTPHRPRRATWRSSVTPDSESSPALRAAGNAAAVGVHDPEELARCVFQIMKGRQSGGR